MWGVESSRYFENRSLIAALTCVSLLGFLYLPLPPSHIPVVTLAPHPHASSPQSFLILLASTYPSHSIPLPHTASSPHTPPRPTCLSSVFSFVYRSGRSSSYTFLCLPSSLTSRSSSPSLSLPAFIPTSSSIHPIVLPIPLSTDILLFHIRPCSKLSLPLTISS